MIWQDVAAFDWQHLFRGVGAGSLAQQDITLDNQFLYAYVELGVLGALIYFALFATLIVRLSSGHPFGRSVLVLLAAAFVVGDILNAHALMFVVGLFLGTIRDREVPAKLKHLVPRTRLAQLSVNQMGSRG
jgi:O-antigen ligase